MKFTSNRRSFPSFDLPEPRPRVLAAFRAAAVFAAMLAVSADAQVGFVPSALNGLVIGTSNKASKVTSLQFGPDNRLYFIQVTGTIIACDVTRQGPNNYVASNVETIDLVKSIPNHNDDGVRNFSLNSRQCTGILVVGTAQNPVIYASSCDPREGAGSGAVDLNLDTNSGVISRLIRTPGGVWEKVDLVRGLPRSEENHACNGLNIDATGTVLYLAQGGNTNAGAPSNNFAFSCETALAAAVLSIDLTAINAMPVQTDAYGHQYIYNLPTVDDPNPSRAHNLDGSDVNDPFGGNDGLNQAKLVQGGPVQVYASGFRNPYDVLIAKTPGKVGKMYTFDNAGNSGWGGYPKNEAMLTGGGASLATNEYVPSEPGTVNNKDGLHLISGPGYYGGHPHPLRANPTGAGWSRYDDVAGQLVFSASPTTDWPPVAPSLADPQQGDFRLPGPESGALLINSASTCGMAEYTASNFGGAMVGDIITAQYSAATVQRVSMSPDGTAVTGSSVLLNGSSFGTPLDVACPGPGAAPALSGTIFVGHHSNKITVLEPSDFDSAGSVCSGIFSFSLDEDNDGYSNADEVSSNSNPCSPAVMPPDNDGDFLSDLLDSDDDNDGIPDTEDVFPINQLNGRNVVLPHSYNLFLTNDPSQMRPTQAPIGFFGIGFTGVMLNPGQNYAQRVDLDELIAGGTAGLFTDPAVGPGNPHGSSNTQVNGFHFGVHVDEFTGPFIASSRLGGLLFNGTPIAGQSQGIYVGNGDQDNYVKIAVHANSGNVSIEVVHEEAGIILTRTLYGEPGLLGSNVALCFRIDPIAGTIHPGYSLGNGSFTYVGQPLAASAEILGAIRGSTAMAFGLLATTGDVGTPTFNATWDDFKVEQVPNTAAAKLTIGSSFGNLNSSSTYSNGSFKIENLSTGGQKITSVTVDIGTALLPDVVFDPLGTAGDLDFKGFQLNSFTGTGSPTGIWQSPENGVDGADGYEVLFVDCGSGVNFGPGELLTFSSDIDPTSVKGVQGPGPFHAASVSGLELIGATVTVTFDDGSVRKVRNSGVTGIEGTHRTSMGVLASGNLPTPGLSVPGKTSPFTTIAQPTVRVVGPAGAEVQIWKFHSALHLDDGVLSVPNGGYDLDPFETNTVDSFTTSSVSIGPDGYIDVPMLLDYDQDIGGIHQIAAMIIDSQGNRSPSSEILTIEYDPNPTPTDAVARVNAGGGTYLDSVGKTWSADTAFTSGSVTGFNVPIGGTTDDTLYQTFRFDNTPVSPLDYVFTVPNGLYQVRLHFAETWSAITQPGQRVFDVFLEGQLALDNLDVFAVAGPNNAHVETLQAQVTDGQVTIALRHVVDNPFICGIEIFSLAGTGPDTVAPSAPGVFTQNNLKAGSVELLWSPATDNFGIAGYRIFRDGLQIAETTALARSVTGLTPATGYVFAIEAFDAAGNVSSQSQLQVTTPADQESPGLPGSIRGISGNGIAMLSWSASTDDAGVVGYRVFRDGLLVGEVTELEFTDSSVVNGTTYLYGVLAFDASGKVSAPAEVSVRPRALGPAVLRVDCGSSIPFIDLQGNTWQADFGFNTGQVEVNTAIAIGGTEDDGLYQSRRHDKSTSPELKYTFPLPDGDYELQLHFGEIWSGATSPGVRVFDVKVQNQLTVNDFDIFAAAGFATAHVVPIPVTVSGGQMTIEFIHVVQNPSVSAIAIYSLDGSPPDGEAPNAPTVLNVDSVTAGSATLSWPAATDNVAVSGYQVFLEGAPVATVNGLTHTVSGLAASTLYEFSVVAKDAAGNSSQAVSTTATTGPDTEAPTPPGSFVGQPGNGVAVLTWAPSSDDSVVTGYELWRDGVLVTTVSSLGYTDAGLVNNTSYLYQVKAVDSAGNRSTPSAVEVTPRALGPALLRVNVGSASSYVDPSGNVWSADFGSNTGYTEPNANVIVGTDIPSIYQSRRIDRPTGVELKYQYDVPNGSYEVRLHFAEVWSGANAPGIRVFDVSLEGVLALDNLDVFAEVGSNAAFVATIPVTVADGKLTIDFQRVVQNPFISGIEIYPQSGSGAAETQPPTTPGGLILTSLTTESVAFAWNASSDNVGVLGYRIFKNGSLVGTVAGLSFVESGLTPGTGYEYQVVAFDAAGNISAPAVLQATTLVSDLEAPSIPTGLTANPGLSHVVLNWNPSTDNQVVAGYRVVREGVLVATVSSPGYSDTNLPSGTEIDYEIFAVDAAGNVSSPANTVVSTLADTEAPSSPTNLLATPAYTTISISWSASSDNAGVTGYRVYRNSQLLGTVGGTTFEDSGLIPQTAYTYEVEATDSAGNLSGRGVVTAVTLPDAEIPTAPGNLRANGDDGSVLLAWSPSSDNVLVAGYQVRRNGSLIATVPMPGYTDTGLLNGTSYSYEVRAVDAAGNLSIAAAASATPRLLGAVMVRVNTGGLAFKDSNGNDWFDDQGFNLGSTLFSSNPISGTEDDVLYQSERYDGNPGGSDLEYSFPVADGLYEVRLHFAETYGQINSAGQRVFDVFAEGQVILDDLDIYARAGSNTALVLACPVEVSDGQLSLRFDHGLQNPKICGIEVFEIVDTLDPSAPTGLAASNITASSVDLTWSPASDNVGVTGYRVYLGAVEIGNVSAPSFTAISLATGTGYTFSVVAFDAAGNESLPALVSATTLVPDTEAPGAPLNLSATPAINSVTLLWEAATDNVAVTGYRVLRGTDTVADNLTVLTWTDTGLASGAGFTYQVFALDAAGNVSPFAGVVTTTLVPPSPFEQWLINNNLTGQAAGDSDKGGLDNLSEFELQMDPNTPADDLTFRLGIAEVAGDRVVSFPVLKPIGNYHLHRDDDLSGIGNLPNRIHSVTKAQIEAMSPEQRASYSIEDGAGGPRAFYQLIFEPVAN